MALQQKAIQRILLTMRGMHNSNPTELLDAAVLSCRSRYHTIQEVIDECLQQRSISSSYTEFLQKRCGIDLNNEDTGALLGFDACGDISKSAISIIPETDISNWKMPETEEVTYGVLKVIYPDLNNLNADERFIVGCLHTWWIERAIHLIAQSYGYEFNRSGVTPKELSVEFKAEGAGVLAYIQTLANLITGKVVEMKLVINTDYYVNMDNTNPNGVSLTYPEAGYLDRTIAHEFVHAVEATNIDFFYYLSRNHKWFTEGSAELIHGIDDERKTNIQAVVSDESRFAQAFTTTPVDVEDVYSAGYVLLRYLLRQISNGYTQRYRIKRHLMTEKGNVQSLKEIGKKFIAFVRRSNNGVQPWELELVDNEMHEGGSYSSDEDYDPNDPSTYPDWMTYPQSLSTCPVVQSNDRKIGYHFFPSEDKLKEADYLLFVFQFKDGSVVYIKPDYAKIMSALDNHQDYDVFSDAKVYVSNDTALPSPPKLPSRDAWQDFSQVASLSGMEYHLRDYAVRSHMMFSGNAQFDTNYVDGEAYLCVDIPAEEAATLDRLSSFYGITVKVPMRNHADIMAEDKYYLLTNPLMENTSADIDFIDVLKAQYQKINFNENYTRITLDNVSSAISSLNIEEQSHIIFSGCEGEIAQGTTLRNTLNKFKSIVQQIKGLNNSRPSLVLTPTVDMFNGDTLKEEYKVFLRNSAISRKLNLVYVGDGLLSDALTNYCQDLLPSINIIDKSVAGNRAIDYIQHFDSSVLEQVPDMCLILIGAQDFWENSSVTDLATAEASFSEMIGRCINNDIIPIVVTYSPTFEQIFKYTEGYALARNPLDIHQDFKAYRSYCKKVANDNNLLYIDNIYGRLLNEGTGSINKEYVLSDLMLLSDKGSKKVGEYIAEKLKDFVFQKQNDISQDYDIINLYDVFCKKLGTEELTKTQFDTLVNNGHYKEGEVLDWITESIFSEGLLRPFNCPCFYVSLEHQNIKTNSYSNWIYYDAYNPGYVHPYIYSASNMRYNPPPGWASRDIYYQNERYPHSYYDKNENPFKNTGEFLAVGLHTLYDNRLWMCEQGGITCEEEATNQIVNMNFMCKEMYRNYSGYAVFPPFSQMPVYPGTGCPWLTLSDTNKSEFDVEGIGITYWFTKSDYDATITIKVGNGNVSEAYQSISLGMMTSINDDSYLFPLYVAGGTEGISEDILNYHNPSPPDMLNVNGNMYDLDIKCPAMSNSNLLTPTKFNGADISNFKVLSPSGVWKNVFNWTQTTSVYPNFRCNGPVGAWYISLNEPTLTNSSSDSLSLFAGDFRNMVDTYTVHKSISKHEHSSPLEKVIVNMTNSLVDGNSNSEGVIPNCYGSWYRTLDVGEIEIDGRKYLSIPNGWENRFWHYPYLPSGIYPQGQVHWKSKVIAENYDEYFKLLSKKLMTHRLIIPLEEEPEPDPIEVFEWTPPPPT